MQLEEISRLLWEQMVVSVVLEALVVLEVEVLEVAEMVEIHHLKGDLEVDLQRQRVSLTMKLDAAPSARAESTRDRSAPHRNPGRHTAPVASADSAMASAFAKLKGLKS
jgi:transcriptional accessory protein Tex/SPT6